MLFTFKSASWPQWIAAIAVFKMALVMSLESGWTSPALAILLSPTSPIPTTKSEASWIASLLSIGRAAGGLIGAIDVEFFGSKTTVLHIGLVQVLGLVLLALANSVSLILISRVICGVASGMLLIAFPLYIGEISNPKIRGALIGVVSNGMSIGYVLGNLTGAYMSIPGFAILALGISVLFILTFYWLPKSPHFLILKDRTDEAGAAILWYQRDADMPKELESLEKFVKDKQAMTVKALFDEFMLPHNKTALLKVMTIYALLQLSGYFTIGFYMEIILTEAQVTIIPPALGVVAVSCAGLIGGAIAMFTIDRFGRKVVLVTTSIGLAGCLIATGLHFQLQETGWFQPERLQWLMITAAMTLECCICLGVVPVPSTILSEFFAPNIKSYSSCLANITSAMVAFLVTQTYQMLVDAIDFYVYFVYAITMILLAVFTVLKLPETKGKSLQEIQVMLMKK